MTCEQKKSVDGPFFSATSIGLRLMQARKMTNLSRRQLEEKYDLKATTLKSWETGRYNGLTEKGTQLMLTILQQENIQCSREWLLYGTGLGPRLQIINHFTDSAEHELDFFRQQHHDTLDYYVADDRLQPHYWQHEIVAGIVQIIDKSSPPYLDYDYLMQQDHKLYLIGKLTFEKGVLFLNSYLQSKHPIDETCLLAPIIWRRRPYHHGS